MQVPLIHVPKSIKLFNQKMSNAEYNFFKYNFQDTYLEKIYWC